MTTLFPGTWELGRKDRLCKNIGKMRRQFPEVFNIQPRSFVLPNDADEWRLECERFPDGRVGSFQLALFCTVDDSQCVTM